MRKSLLFCCIAALPLAACATDGRIAQQTPPAAVAGPATPDGLVQPVAYKPAGSPVAVLVVMPGSGALADVPPALWADQGFDVITPRITEALLAERSADLARARMLAYARAMARAPIWLVGSGPEIQETLERLPAGAGQVSGVVMTSVSSPSGSCSRTVVYSSQGSGGQPTVQVRSAGNACDAIGISPGARPPVFEQVPEPSPSKLPRTLLVRADQPARGALAQARTNPPPLVQQVADRIKQAPEG